MKKIISLLTVLTLVLSMLAVTAMNTLAAGEAVLGSGTEADPYLIGSKEALAAFAAAPVEGAFYKLTADIVWSEYKQGGTAPAESNWTPIVFDGTFDGDGHTVSGLYVKGADTGVGFFGKANGVIKNLTVKDSYFEGEKNVGGIVGSVGKVGTDKAAPESITIENCVNYADVTAKNTVAGIIGYPFGNTNSDNNHFITVTISKCVNHGDVTGTEGNGYAGGIAGRLLAISAVIDQCANFGDVSAAGALAGGIVGQGGRNGATEEPHKISNCYNAGKITATYLSGGIIGRAYATPFDIENCVNVGAVVARTAGKANFGPIDGHSASTVKNSFYLEGSATNEADATLVPTGTTTGTTAKALADINSAATATALGDKWEYNATDGLVLKFMATASQAPETTTPSAPETTAPSAPGTSAPTTQPATPPATGDVSAVILAAVCVTGLAAVMVAKKKR